jgi:hypothetical protein
VTLSSAILYLAIVGIWAMVLVPRWLRPPHASGTLESNLAEPLDAGMQEDLAGVEDGEEDLPIHGDQVAAAAPAGSARPAGRPGSAGHAGAAGNAESARRAGADGAAGRAGAAEAQARGGGQAGDEPAASSRPGPQQTDGRAGPVAAERKAYIMKARRRALATLIVLTGGAVAIAVTRLAAPWVAIPPAVMLAGFVLLLRAAARIDTERARAAASLHARATGAEVTTPAEVPTPAKVPTSAEVPTPTEVPDARIIDISARVGDQLYDQYADTEVRAVGD